MMRPKEPLRTPIEVFIPKYTNIKGVEKREFPTSGIRMNCSFKTYGGTETTVNGVLVIEDTAKLMMWFDPQITADAVIKNLNTGKLYEVMGDPENIDDANQFMQLKVKRVDSFG